MNRKNPLADRKILIIAVLLLFIWLSGISVALAGETGGNMSEEDLKKPPSPAEQIIKNFKYDAITWSPPQVGKEVERVELKNGIILYLKEDHSLPVVTINAVIRSGKIYEKKEEKGLAGLTGSVMRTGGTDKLSPDQLNEELESLGATLETGISSESGSAYLQILSRQLDKGMDLYSQVLRTPAFDQKELELAKTRIKEKIRRQNDDVQDIGEREFYKLVYGDCPQGWSDDWSVVKNIKREDLKKWHQRFYKPNNIMFAVVGDFNREDILKKFDKYFGDWQKGHVDFSTLKDLEYKFNPGIFYAEKDVNQAYIRFGHLGVKRDNPDIYAITIMNFVLGGGSFNSLMWEKVRSDQGLAYMVYAYFNTSSRDYGTTGAVSQTKSQSAVKAYKTMVEQIHIIRSQPMPEDKIQWAKDTLINGYLFDFERPDQQVYKLMMLEYDHMPLDFYDNYRENLEKVTQEDVLRVAQKYLQPDQLTVVFVGNKEKFDSPLESLGEVKAIKIEDFKE